MNARTRQDRAVIWLGVVALVIAASTVLRGDLDVFRIREWGVVVTAGLGVLAILAGVLAVRLLALVAAAGFLAAGIVQLVQLDGYLGNVGHGVLGGNMSTVAGWLALALGLAVLGFSPVESVKEDS